MELLKAGILGMVQGLTEFLPVSSSGHLVIGSELMHFREQGIVFDVFLHLGTLMAVFVVFRTELLAMVKAPFLYRHGQCDREVRDFFLWDIYVVVATLPAVFVGLFLKDTFERFFNNIVLVYCMLTVTGLLMIGTKLLSARNEPLTWFRSLLVGCAQACAILPGLSRSGSTIFAGMALGVDREKIARFSFIMSIPAILGAAVLQLRDVLYNSPGGDAWLNILVGTVMAAISGYLAIQLLLGVIRKNKLQWFGYYCLLLAGAGLTHFFFFT